MWRKNGRRGKKRTNMISVRPVVRLAKTARLEMNLVFLIEVEVV